jgi:cholesterol oxidase
VSTAKSTARFGTGARRFTCRGVVFAASALGTMDLLFRLKQKRSLPAISNQLGNRVRTNAESLIGVRIPGNLQDLSKCIAVGSGVYLDDQTHIEVVRYPEGSNAMSLLSTLLVEGSPGRRRILLWLATLAVALLRHPTGTWRSLRPSGRAKETLILLCMQTLDGHIDMRLRRRWFWPFGRTLVSQGRKVPTFIPRANEFANQIADMTDGIALSLITEILFNIPGTAHILGGSPIGSSPEDGVVDQRHRVFGYKNMYVCDGSVIAANLGVNPSLTICALTERAMSHIPRASVAKWNDAPIVG